MTIVMGGYVEELPLGIAARKASLLRPKSADEQLRLKHTLVILRPAVFAGRRTYGLVGIV